jgi:hypothetical protein
MKPHSPTFSSNNPGASQFAWEWTSTGAGWQHSGYEVWKSFRYDTTEARSVNYYARPFADTATIAADHDGDEEHLEDHDHENADLIELYVQSMASPSVSEPIVAAADVLPGMNVVPHFAGLHEAAATLLRVEDNVTAVLLQSGDDEIRDELFAEIFEEAESETASIDGAADRLASLRTAASTRSSESDERGHSLFDDAFADVVELAV